MKLFSDKLDIHTVASPLEVPDALRAAAAQYRQEPAPIWQRLAAVLDRAALDAERAVQRR